MYGGQATGMYTRSMADLSGLCTRYGIPLQIYFLFNESLIPRARGYSVDEFIRSDSTHMIFIDADIGFDANDVITLLALASDESEYDVIGAAYPKKCLPSTAMVHTEHGKMSIAKVVKQKYNGKVKSLDRNNNVVWRKITDHMVSRNNCKKWVGLSTANWQETSKIAKRSKVICTDDHEIAYISNPLKPDVKYAMAKSLSGKYLVQTPKDCENTKDSSKRHPLLNSEQVSVLVGASLGDGCVTNSLYTGIHGSKQSDYNQFKHKILGGNFHEYEFNNSLTFISGQTQHIADLIYENGKKTVKNVIDYIDDIALAIMYMDDGNRYYYPDPVLEETTERTWWYNEKDGGTLRQLETPGDAWHRGRKCDAWRATSSIATMSFSVEDNLLLVAHINEKFGITASVGYQGGQPFLKFDKDNTDLLHKLICKYVPKSMEYKLNDEFRSGEKHSFNNVPLAISASKITDIVDVESDSMLYDIEVEDTHNFFINDGVLVHNCVSWEKIKVAVDKGMADQNPNNLEKFVGDYVFNPKVNTGSIRIDEPVEVMELGTGFMMIRRPTFDKYKDAYPTLSYKPDHVRTEHFDGSREIMMYFDCAIDRGYDFQEMHDLVEELSKIPDATDPKLVGITIAKAQAMLEKEKTASMRYLSEDYFFCHMSQKLGMKIWLCPWMKLQHVGTYVFGGSLADLAQLGVAATADGNELQKFKDNDKKAKEKFSDRITKGKK